MIDRAKMAATTEADIHRHAIEDGEPADGDLPDCVLVVPSARLRLHLGMSQAVFALAIGVPLKTVQNWEQGRTPPDPAARTLLALVAADPHHVLGLLGWEERDDVPDGQALEAGIGRQSARNDKPTGRWFQRDADVRWAKTAARRA